MSFFEFCKSEKVTAYAFVLVMLNYLSNICFMQDLQILLPPYPSFYYVSTMCHIFQDWPYNALFKSERITIPTYERLYAQWYV